MHPVQVKTKNKRVACQPIRSKSNRTSAGLNILQSNSLEATTVVCNSDGGFQKGDVVHVRPPRGSEPWIKETFTCNLLSGELVSFILIPEEEVVICESYEKNES